MVDVPSGDYISLAQAAEIIGCTKRNAQNYVEAGQLPAIDVDVSTAEGAGLSPAA